MKKTLIVIVVLLLTCSATLLFARGQNGDAPTEAVEEEPVELMILETVESHGYALIELGKEWEKRTGVKITVEQFPYEPTYEKEVLVLSSGGSDYDLIAYDCFWGPLFMANGWLLSIDQFIDDPNMPDIDFDAFISPAAFRSYMGKTYAAPIDFTTPIMAYRKDLFEEEGLTSPPETWDEFADYARRLTKDTDNDGEIDQFGVVLHFGGIDSGFTEWIVRIAGYPRPAGEDKYILNADNTKTIFGDQEYSTRALEIYKDLIPYAPAGSIGYDYPEATELFNQGKAAMFITWQVLLFESEVPDKSAVAGKLGYAPPPVFTERNNYVGGWQLAIPKNTKYPEEAYEFMAWVVSEEGQELMLEAGSPTAFRKKALSDPKWIEVHPVMGAMGALNPIPLPVVEQFVEMQYTIFENLGLAVADRITPEEAIERAAREVDAILAE